jgi:hypothetical protein
MISLGLSEEQFEILGYALRRARRIELADAATRGRRKVRNSFLERAQRIEWARPTSAILSMTHGDVLHFG